MRTIATEKMKTKMKLKKDKSRHHEPLISKQEEPEGTRKSQKEPGEARKSQDEPDAG